MKKFKDSVAAQVLARWHEIEDLFDFSKDGQGGKKLTPQEATELLWNEFEAKWKRKKPDAKVVSAELEVLYPMPWRATVYRKVSGKWEEIDAEGETPLTAHVIGEVEWSLPNGQTDSIKVFHRFIGKTFPQYVGN
jgi:hypothetical protein